MLGSASRREVVRELRRGSEEELTPTAGDPLAAVPVVAVAGAMLVQIGGRRRVLDRGYEATTFTRAVLDPPAARTVAVTFDDGFRSVREVGLPVLESLGVPATLFVPTALIGRREPFAWPGLDRWAHGGDRDELRGLRWDEVAELAALGWEIGSHTRTHPRLTELDDRALTAELHALLPAEETFMISASTGDGLDRLLDRLVPQVARVAEVDSPLLVDRDVVGGVERLALEQAGDDGGLAGLHVGGEWLACSVRGR